MRTTGCTIIVIATLMQQVTLQKLKNKQTPLKFYKHCAAAD